MLNRTIENLLDSSAEITAFVSGSLQLAKVIQYREECKMGIPKCSATALQPP
jgi:hypothetical protein